jgi:NDP-sugar pyrophosphorylase family protein
MKSMILAAGFGTRLRPLTDERPKALMPVANRPMLLWSMDYLRNYGATDIVINAHHHQEKVVEYVRQRSSQRPRTEVSVEPEILGTGGGIKNVEDFLGREPFVVMNVDILTDIDLQAALQDHKNSGALVTLVLHDCASYNQIQVDRDLNITDIGKKARSGRLAFTGIHMIHPKVLSFIPSGVFSDIMDCYRRLILEGKPVKAYVSRNHYWRDIGSMTQYVKANRDFAGRPFLIGSGCRIHPSVKLEDWAVIGDGCRIEEGVSIRRSILWENVDIRRGLNIMDSVISSGNGGWYDLRGGIY